MRKVRINVTQRDIDTWINPARSNDVCSKCAVAKAIRRHKGFEAARVGLNRFRTDNYFGKCLSIELPIFVQGNINQLDAFKAIAPFKFSIEVPDNV